MPSSTSSLSSPRQLIKLVLAVVLLMMDEDGMDFRDGLAILSLQQCSIIRNAWCHNSTFSRLLLHHSTVSNFLTALLNEGDRQALSLCFYLMWMIWKARNKFVFENRKIDINRIISEATTLQETYEGYNLQDPILESSTTSIVLNQTWQPPLNNNLKINFDGAFLDGKMAAAALLRDGSGRFLGAVSKSQHGGSPIEAEALGIHLSLLLVEQHNLSNTVIEGNCKPLIDAFLSKFDTIIWLARHTICSARNLLQTSNNISYSFVRRSGNMCAHQLASHALLFNPVNTLTIHNCIPPCISEAVDIDISQCNLII
ncbi:uncharacterized protein M6B38_289225 [Iris pallida]|uniref:RNase H type-1 domain-containing protein n=1 Tax=Iris pallida TaxID=29817 RepID=A0AAX6HWD6_IRIPA|nr:uncharacterized protein M6B38_289225 [Iris pallida]